MLAKLNAYLFRASVYTAMSSVCKEEGLWWECLYSW